MTFVITQRCCDDAACVPVCPVQCIRPRPGDPDFSSTEQLYIDPLSCIDCGACATACPVDAIFPESDLPPALTDFSAINAEYFAAHPLIDVSPLPVARHRLPPGLPTLRVAIVGAGPAALYAAIELSELNGVEVTLFERLPTPFGLVRAGVAPDHDATKSITERLGRVLVRPNVQCLFDVEVGRDVSAAELLEHHHAVLWATGASADRKLNIPGEDLVGSVSAQEFVSWYNGHPDSAARDYSLSGRRAIVIGNGNVALDVARLLVQPALAYATTSVSDNALKAMATSTIDEVMVIGRRAQVFAAYGTAELAALTRLPEVDLLAEPSEVGVTDDELEAAALSGRSWALARRRAIIDDAANRTPTQPRRIIMRYRASPTALLGNEAVTGLVVAGPDGTSEQLETSLVIRAVGFRGRPVPGMPFDIERGVLPNNAGRVVDPQNGRPVRGIYCAGWIKRGPSGVIGTNRVDSAETVTSLLEDFERGNLKAPTHDTGALVRLIRERQPNVLDVAGWQRIDETELAAGRGQGRSRVKLLTWEDLRAVGRSDGD
ncbi:ferredoxin--NADP+ reductase [Nocardioides alpinus]|uniref:ferredoxin--NADP(+) reductase n=2 Tax=Nocardioides TaxID=1839 RepID=A0A4Q2SMI0_9ACTN|nr:ferredoxin--NADP(+) reductase [Nocardioides alpinus]RYC05364.1 4Fe-4S dicluster domain-containing protein [Nocardioides zhouii]SFB47766.1 ferredoxin--NADP+ reductase [Nocardioides alpinus]